MCASLETQENPRTLLETQVLQLGNSALTRLGMAASGKVDICVTDMDMPAINGFKLLH